MFVGASLATGGAERVMTLLSNAFVARGHAVDIVTTLCGWGEPAFALDSAVGVHRLTVATYGAPASGSRVWTPLLANAAIVRGVRRYLRGLRPDAVVAFMDTTNIVTLLATRGSGVPVIVSERTDPAGLRVGRVWDAMRRITYPWADAVVCQGRRPLAYFGTRIRSRGVVIPNPVALPEGVTRDATRERRGTPRLQLVSIGSLRPVKGHAVLIRAFGRVAAQHAQWDLTIWGEGASRADLERQIQLLDLADRVQLPGRTPDPFGRLSAADAFVLPSLAEGFPNALVEAMSLGLPVVATDVGAVDEIVTDGANGLLVPAGDDEALAQALGRLMGGREERASLAEAARTGLERFSVERVARQWEDLISSACARRQRRPAR